MRRSFTFRGIFVLFARDWVRSREWPCLWQGIPALVAGIGLLVLLAFAQLDSPEERGQTYLTAGRRAFHTGNVKSSEIFYKRSLQEWPNDRVALLEAAALADELEDATRRDAILRRLVEEEADPAGMLFQGLIALRERRDAKAIEDARAILKRALSIADDTARKNRSFVRRLDELRRALAAAESLRGEWRNAVEYRQALDHPTWEDRTLLAETLLILGKREEVQTIVESLGQDLIASSEDDGLTHRRNALLAAFRGEEESAIRHLVLGGRLLVDEGEAGRNIWAQSAVRVFQLLRLSKEAMPSLKSLDLALSVSPMLPSLVEELLALVGVGSHPYGPAMNSSILTEYLARGDSPVAAHLIAGLADLRQGNEDGADLHFTIAGALYPATGLVLTRCGLRLARLGETYEQLALTLGETGAGMMEQGHLGARLGHGQILLSLERWQEAIDWLAPLREGHEELVDPLLNAAEERLKAS